MDLPVTFTSFLISVCPLILDGSAGVRNQLLKLFRTLPEEYIRDNVTKILPYMRAGMTHLSREIRISAIDFLSYLIEAAGAELVSSAGGWYQTLECFTTVLGWKSTDSSKWSANKATFAGDVKSTTRIMQVLGEFLQAGFATTNTSASGSNALALDFPLWQTATFSIPATSNAYAYLNLFGKPQDDEKQMLDDREDRLRVYVSHFQGLLLAGIDAAKKEGGELGRASGLLVKALDRTQNT